MALDPHASIVVVTDSAGSNQVFTNAHAVTVVSQNVEDELTYLSLLRLAEGYGGFSEEVRDDIKETIALGQQLHPQYSGIHTQIVKISRLD